MCAETKGQRVKKERRRVVNEGRNNDRPTDKVWLIIKKPDQDVERDANYSNKRPKDHVRDGESKKPL
jgi:hypothetical protein